MGIPDSLILTFQLQFFQLFATMWQIIKSQIIVFVKCFGRGLERCIGKADESKRAPAEVV
jgi:hypothetical protein